MIASIRSEVLHFENCAVENEIEDQHDLLLFKACCFVKLLKTVLW